MALFDMIKGGGQMKDAARKVGKAYLETSQRPDFFSLGPSSPAHLADIESKYELRSIMGDDDELIFRPRYNDVTYGMYTHSGADLLDNIGEGTFMMPEHVEDVQSRIEPDRLYATINAIDSSRGSGAGKNLYPAMYDYMAARGIRNLPDPAGMTEDSFFRRNLNALSPLLRHKDTQLITPSRHQISDVGMLPDEFMDLPLEDQVGNYLFSGAHQANKALNRDLDMARNLSRKGMNPGYDDVERLGVYPDFVEYGGLTPSSTPSQYRELVDTLRGSGVKSVGSDTLKKMMFIDSVLGGTSMNPDSLRHLERKSGGLVQRPGEPSPKSSGVGGLSACRCNHQPGSKR
jgi:hypothetical protein